MSRPARSPRSRRSAEAGRRNRRLFLEPLEQRALLAVIGVMDQYTTLEDTPLHISADGIPDTAPGTWLELPGVLYNDTGSTTLVAELISQPVYGDVILSADGSFDYTPLGNSTVTDTFTYRATDGTDYSDPVTVEIHITPVNDPPFAIGDSYTANKNSPLTIPAQGVLLNDLEPENEPLTATLGTPPAHGTLTFNADGSFTFTPVTNYLGPDSFTYLASDGALTDETTVSLTVIDLPPDVPTKAYTVQKNSPLTVPAAAGLLDGVTDPDDPGVSFYALLTTAPQHGTVDVNPDGSFTYTPSSNYTGPDIFGVEIGHAGGGSVVAAVNVGLNVLQPNQAPLAVNDQFLLDEDTVRTGNVLANDDDPDTATPLTASLVSTVSHGTLTLNPDGSFLYTPSLNWFGTDIFTYTILDDGQPTVEDLPPESLPIGFTATDFTTLITLGSPLDSNTATVSLVVAPINDLPVTTDIEFDVEEDSQLLEPGGMYIGVTDPDNDPGELTPIITTPPAFGIIVISPGGSIIYTPDPGFIGSVNFGFIINDPTGPSNPGTGTIEVTPVNDPPVAVDDAFVLDEDALYFAGDVSINDSDPDGPSLSFSLVSGVSQGGLILQSNGIFNYTPNPNYFGSDSFTYQVSDGTLTAIATVTLTIQAVNDAPIAVDDAFESDEDTVIGGSVISNDFDPDDDPLTTATVVTGPTNGSLLWDPSGSFTYTPNLNFHGEDSFSYYVYDNTNLQSNTATVTLTTNSVNDAPTAQDQSYTTDEDTPLTIPAPGLLTGASDPENAPLTVSIIDQPLHGTLEVNADGSFTYTPHANYFGSDSFFFGVSDASLTATATVSLTIDDTYSRFSIAAGSPVAEPGTAENTANLTFTITYTDTAQATRSVGWRAEPPGPPQAGFADEEDFAAVEGIVDLGPGSGSETIQIPIVFDVLTEPDELVRVVLFNPSEDAEIDGNGYADGTITDTEYSPPFSASIELLTAPEVDEGSSVLIEGVVVVTSAELPTHVTLTNSTTNEALGTATVDSETGDFELVHTFLDDLDDGTAPISQETYEIVATATISGEPIESSTEITVYNIAPTITIGVADPTTAPIDAIGDGGPILLVIDSITDPGTEASGFTVHIDWGDDTDEQLTLPQNTAWPYYVEHEYDARPNDPNPTHTYRIIVTVADDDSGTSTAETALTAIKSTPSDKPEVGIESVDDDAHEVRRDTATFRVFRDETPGNVKVKLVPTHGGSPLVLPNDYILQNENGRLLTNTYGYVEVTIPDGEDDVIITVTPRNDAFREGDENLTLTIANYTFGTTPYDISGTHGSATITIHDGWGVVSLETITAEVNEDANVGILRFGNAITVKATFWGSYSGQLPLAYTGAATADDYTAPSTAIFASSGATNGVFSYSYIRISPVGDLLEEDSETVDVTLASGAAANGLEVVLESGKESGGGTIVDDDSGRTFRIIAKEYDGFNPEIVDFTNATHTVQEGKEYVLFLVRDKSTRLPQTVHVTYAGSASRGVDYQFRVNNTGWALPNLSLTATFPADTYFATQGSNTTPGTHALLARVSITQDTKIETLLETIDLTVVPKTDEGSPASGTLGISPSDLLPNGVVVEIESDLPLPEYYDWQYYPQGGYWTRLKLTYEWEPHGGPIGLGLATGAGIPEGTIGSYTLTSEIQGAINIGAGPFVEVTGSVSVAITKGASLSTNIQAKRRDGIAGKLYEIMWLERKVYFFEQRIYAPDSTSPPDPNAVSEGSVEFERRVHATSNFREYPLFTDGAGYAVVIRDGQ